MSGPCTLAREAQRARGLGPWALVLNLESCFHFILKLFFTFFCLNLLFSQLRIITYQKAPPSPRFAAAVKRNTLSPEESGPVLTVSGKSVIAKLMME